MPCWYTLGMETKSLLAKYKIVPDAGKDQFFLIDPEVIGKMISLAELNKNDIVLEIGAGSGIFTRELAEKVRKVIAFEIDARFKPILKDLPKNVEMHFANVWDFVQLHGKFYKKKVYNKIVANLPYSFVEQLLHNLTFLNYDKVILLVPLKFVNKIKSNGVFGSFFDCKLEFMVAKEKFYPIPRTNSAVINLLHLPDPIQNKDLGLFLRQYLYQHEERKVKNSLMEGIIKFAKLADEKNLTKNQARKIVAGVKLPKSLLEIQPSCHEIYDLVGEGFKIKP